uniref:C-type lectin domain-containing protein n=1 Tax=Lates calcarifer TaxID=8187 RepID=A0A4W6DVB0_LATCA
LGRSLKESCWSLDSHQKKNGIIYQFISTLKTWDSAREYCREYHTDMAMIESSAENAEVYSVKPALAQVWIGLYRVPWTWSDNSEYSFKNWLPLQPDNFLFNQFCVVENALHQWNDEPCALEFPFICQKGDSSLKFIANRRQQYVCVVYYTLT